MENGTNSLGLGIIGKTDDINMVSVAIGKPETGGTNFRGVILVLFFLTLQMVSVFIHGKDLFF